MRAGKSVVHYKRGYAEASALKVRRDGRLPDRSTKRWPHMESFDFSKQGDDGHPEQQ